MAFTVTPIVTGASARSWEVLAALAADVVVDIPHGLGVAPLIVTVSPVAAAPGNPDFNQQAGWSVDRVATDATNIRIRKSPNVGSAGAICLVVAHIPIR